MQFEMMQTILFFFNVLVALGFHRCAQDFSSRSELGLLFIVVLRLLAAVASLAAEHGL